MPERPFRVAIITGSTREGRFGPVVAGWFAAQAGLRNDMVLDPSTWPRSICHQVLPRRPAAGARAYIDRIERADAFVIVTELHRPRISGGAEQAIDLPHVEWRAKPVGFVSYGGLAGGLRAVEQLRQVFAELHAVGEFADAVELPPDFPSQFDEQVHDADGCGLAVTTMLTSWRGGLRHHHHRVADAARSTAAVIAAAAHDPHVLDAIASPRAASASRTEGAARDPTFSRVQLLDVDLVEDLGVFLLGAEEDHPGHLGRSDRGARASK